MTWTNLSFSSGAILTASNMNALQTNFSAVASGTSGAPDLASINKAWVVFSANGHIMNSENVSSGIGTSTHLAEATYLRAGIVVVIPKLEFSQNTLTHQRIQHYRGM